MQLNAKVFTHKLFEQNKKEQIPILARLSLQIQ